ncbi:hypothetical protein H4R34_005543, partial [Dimargaris verticillata]
MIGATRLSNLTLRRGAHLARAPKKAATPYGAATHTSNDRRHDVIKKVLFDTPPRASPAMTDEDVERHAVIERAWQLFTQKAQAARDAVSKQKFARMQQAYEELRNTDYRLFLGAVHKNETLLFPKA